MNNNELLAREVEILRQVPHDQVGDFIERNGQRMRDLLEDEEWHSNLEIIEALQKGYSE